MAMAGTIIAYRPVELITQVPSFSLNREAFLVHIEKTSSGATPELVKVVYEHLGYTGLTYDVLHATPLLLLRVSRERACDETYESFAKHGPVLRDATTGAESLKRIVFVGRFSGTSVPDSQRLNCYVLHHYEALTTAAGP